LVVLARRLGDQPPRFDSLDPRRRFDFVHPAVSARILAELGREPEAAAQGLLALAEELLEPDWPDFPRRGVAAMRLRLGWDRAN
jgi:hypothetical protein